MFAAGIVAALIGVDARHLQTAIGIVLSGKGAEAVTASQTSAAAGIEAAVGLTLNLRLDPPQQSSRWLISGNQALALGALRGGVRFVGCYPITPATGRSNGRLRKSVSGAAVWCRPRTNSPPSI